MRDIDIRKILLGTLEDIHGNDPDTLVVEELGLRQGEVRIDVAVINGSMQGYEIKSERDTLKRLPRQQEVYNKTLDSVVLVASEDHLEIAEKEVPAWWGLSMAKYYRNEVEIFEIRPPKANNDLDPHSLVQLLWRDESLEILKERCLHKGLISKPRDILWERLVEYLTIEELRKEVRKKVKQRKNWRSVQPRR